MSETPLGVEKQVTAKQATVEDRALLRELRAENKRLQAKIAKLEVKEISYKNRVVALEGEITAGGNRAIKKLLDDVAATGARLPLSPQPGQLRGTTGDQRLTGQSGALTNANHNQIDAFLKRALNAYKNDEITLQSAVAGLAHVMSALDKGNVGEAVAWFNQDGVSHFKA